jgi:hypothetical protein
MPGRGAGDFEGGKAMRVCRHCKEEYGTRTGRGLCWRCWRTPEIKAQYGPLAPFGGAAAGQIWKQQKEEAKKAKEAG